MHKTMTDTTDYQTEQDVMLSRQEWDTKEEVKVELVESTAEWDKLRPVWNRIVEESGAHIFQTYQWQRTWWKHFHEDNDLFIMAFYYVDRIVGIAPMFVEKSTFGNYEVYRRLRLIGSSVTTGDVSGTFTDYSPSDYLDFVAYPECKEVVAEEFLTFLESREEQFDEISFRELREDGMIYQYVLPKLARHGEWKMQKEPSEKCPMIFLSGEMKHYLQGLSRKARYELRYSKRAVTEKDKFRVERISTPEEMETAFDRFVELHQARWNRQGMPGAFADNRYTDFLRDVTGTFLEEGWLRMSTAVSPDDKCVAVEYGIAFSDRIYDYLKAFDDTSPLAKYSPGKALVYFLIEQGIEEECEVYDLLRGDERYKMRLAARTEQNWHATIRPKREEVNFGRAYYAVQEFTSGIKYRINREKLLVKVHVNQFGWLKFIPRYWNFITGRIKSALA
ncbi:MAG: GNAT family N-acetyltransferase [Candidatus Marinimicrobia bacterium]|nr:GNAT family N-acetyltransferase [Candidatus Neomarinimicrobiota bacterium]